MTHTYGIFVPDWDPDNYKVTDLTAARDALNEALSLRDKPKPSPAESFTCDHAIEPEDVTAALTETMRDVANELAPHGLTLNMRETDGALCWSVRKSPETKPPKPIEILIPGGTHENADLDVDESIRHLLYKDCATFSPDEQNKISERNVYGETALAFWYPEQRVIASDDLYGDGKRLAVYVATDDLRWACRMLQAVLEVEFGG